MIPLSTPKYGEFCRNLTFRCAIPLRRHFPGPVRWVALRLFGWFVRWFLRVLAFLGHVFQSFCFDAALQNKRKQSRPVTTIMVQAQATAPPCDRQTKWDLHRRDKEAQHAKGHGRARQTNQPVNKAIKTRTRRAKIGCKLGQCRCCITCARTADISEFSRNTSTVD